MIAVQETGVEAAAATAVIGDGAGAPGSPIAMVVDRPYVISLVDLTTGAVLFLGHVADPTEQGSP